jgi:thiol-disulfide isomerase/thioredoxin
MLKKILLTVGAVTLFALVLFLIFGIVEKLASKKEAKVKIETLPQATLVDLDSVAYTIPSVTFTCLIHFNSGCEHCQYELKEIKNNQKAFINTKVILVSSESIKVIKSTSVDFGLDGMPNIHFVKINPEHVFDTFGSLLLPHIFIYGKDSKLIKEFKGEAKVEAILKYLP